MLVVALLLCVFNILMWVVFLVKFKRLFSTDKIIADARDIMNSMLMDMNRNAERNVSLMEEKIRELKEVQQETLRIQGEADRRLSFMEARFEAASKSADFGRAVNSLSDAADDSPKKKVLKRTSGRTSSRSKKVNEINSSDTLFQPNAVIDSIQENISEAKAETAALPNHVARYKAEQVQGPRLGEKKNPMPLKEGSLKEEAAVPKVVVSENPIVPKKSLSRQVQELAAFGMTEEEIAAKVGITVQEIKLMLEFS